MKYLIVIKDPDSARWEWNLLDGPFLEGRGFTSNPDSLIPILQKFTNQETKT